MKRSTFLKRLGVGTAAVAVAPLVVKELVRETPEYILEAKESPKELKGGFKQVPNRINYISVFDYEGQYTNGGKISNFMQLKGASI